MSNTIIRTITKRRRSDVRFRGFGYRPVLFVIAIYDQKAKFDQLILLNQGKTTLISRECQCL